MKKYFQLYDVANDYSLSPVKGKYQFGDLAHAKKAAQDDIDKWVEGMENVAAPLSSYKIKWGRSATSGIRPDAKMEWNGSIHDGELVYKIIERRTNPVKKKTRKGNPERITQDWLNKRVSLLNDMLGRPSEAYTKTASGLTGNRGHLFIDHAYGGVKVAEMSGGGTGENNISDGYVSKRELNNFINGMIAAVRLTERKGNPARVYQGKRKAKISSRDGYAVALISTGEFFWRGRGGYAAPPEPYTSYEKANAAVQRIAKDHGNLYALDDFEIHSVPLSVFKKRGTWTRKKNPASDYDGKGKHLVFLFGRDKLKFVGKQGKNYIVVDTKAKAHKFKTFNAANELASFMILPRWAGHAGTMKASLPKSHAENVRKITLKSISGKV